ncbi:MAG: hypothetical protein HY257_08285, partial [Chloroflexi bacterium]|nr:hypothetical protein [Chloroflexota bacterium]
MLNRKMFLTKSAFSIAALVVIALIAIACAPSAPTTVGKFQIPDVVKGKYNVAFIYVGPHDDGGWTQAHDIGRQELEKKGNNLAT